MNIDLDESDPFDLAIAEMLDKHRSKKADYAGKRHPFANFYGTARQTHLTPGAVIEIQVANKQERIRSLTEPGRKPNHESLEDSRLDRAVYSTIALAMQMTGDYEKDWEDR